jgi:hypothetical protein
VYDNLAFRRRRTSRRPVLRRFAGLPENSSFLLRSQTETLEQKLARRWHPEFDCAKLICQQTGQRLVEHILRCHFAPIARLAMDGPIVSTRPNPDGPGPEPKYWTLKFFLVLYFL